MTNLTDKQKEQVVIHSCNSPQNVPLKLGMSVKMKCDLCDGSIGDKPHVLKFANFERFFCCKICKTQFQEKNKGRIQSLIEKAKES